MITVPTREALVAQTLANLKAARPQLDTGKGSPEWARVNAMVEAMFGIHYNVRAVQESIWPSADTPTADLEEHAELRLGEDARRGAVKAKGTDALTVTGTAVGATVVAGDSLVHGDGTRFQLTEGAVIGSGTANLSIEAITAGVIGNKLTGDTLTFESPPANITATATLVVDLAGGRDQETDGELLERVIFAYRNPPAGGRFSDYWNWAMAVDGVGGAFVYGPSSYALTGRRGLGIVDLAIVAPGTGTNRIPSAALQLDVQDAIDAVRPSPARDVDVLIPVEDSNNIDVQVEVADGYEFDWTGSGVVFSYAAKVITWVSALPATLMAAVDAGLNPRLMVAGQVFTVASYVAVAQTTTINETPTTNPANPDPIYPGGPVTAAAIAAIKTYVDTLGPARGDGAGTNWADPNQKWEDQLRVEQISATLLHRVLTDGSVVGIEGIKGTTVVTPAADVVPTDPVTTAPELITYGVVTVRSA